MPKGMTLLSEEKSGNSLCAAEERRRDEQDSLQDASCCRDSIAHQAQGCLEQKLHEIESAISVFSRKKVYVREDA